jgi:hypothetical protein
MALAMAIAPEQVILFLDAAARRRSVSNEYCSSVMEETFSMRGIIRLIPLNYFTGPGDGGSGGGKTDGAGKQQQGMINFTRLGTGS